jgi:hypothetical protein
MKLFTLLIPFLIVLGKGSDQDQVICPTPNIPTGWIVIGTQDCAGCCGVSGAIVHKLIIKRIDNLPSGTSLTICPTPNIPDGWVVIGTQACAGCCGVNGSIINKPVIKKL